MRTLLDREQHGRYRVIWLFLVFLVPSIAGDASAQQRPLAPVGNTVPEPAVVSDKPKPLTKAELLDLLGKGVTAQHLSDIARERDIAFPITPEADREIRQAGGNGDLIKTLRALATEGTGILYVGSEPAGAQVTLDGKPVGTTPLTQESVDAGPHRLVVTRAPYRSRELEVTVEPNVVTRSIVEFEKVQLVDVTIETDFEAGTLSVDDMPAGELKPTQRLSLSTGIHRFLLQSSAMGGEFRKEVDINGSEQKILFLKADYVGNVTILSETAIAKLEVSGREVPSPPVTVRDIPAGVVSIRGTNARDHVTKTVNVSAGEVALLRIARSDFEPNPPEPPPPAETRVTRLLPEPEPPTVPQPPAETFVAKKPEPVRTESGAPRKTPLQAARLQLTFGYTRPVINNFPNYYSNEKGMTGWSLNLGADIFKFLGAVAHAGYETQDYLEFDVQNYAGPPSSTYSYRNNGDQRVIEYSAGPRLSLRYRRITVFVQALYGGHTTRSRNSYQYSLTYPTLPSRNQAYAYSFSDTRTGFGMNHDVGIDIRINDRLHVRPFQVGRISRYRSPYAQGQAARIGFGVGVNLGNR